MRRCPYEKIPVYDSCPVWHRLFLQGKHRSPETGRFSARHGKKPWKDPPVPQSQRRFLFWGKKRKERTRKLIQKGALLDKYFDTENLSIDETEDFLKIFSNYIKENKPDKYKKN